ncbi:MAG: hypothetical protein ACQ9IQ_10990 [Nitrospirales bacterium]
MLKSLQKANISDRIDESCKSKEMITPTHGMIGVEREKVLDRKKLIVGSGNDGTATELTIILIQGECDAQRI